MHQSLKPATLPRYSIIVPAHNEEGRIGATLSAYAPAFDDSEVIVVLNGCTDGTEAVVQQFVDAYPHLRMVTIAHAVGKGGAVRAGFLLARATIVGYVDADGSTSAPEMRRLCDVLAAQPEVDGVIASRWLHASIVTVEQTTLRRFVSRAFNMMVRALFGLPYADTQCGAKVFRTAALSPVLRDVETSNLAFDVDLLVALKRRGSIVREEPTVWADRANSKVRVVTASTRMASSVIRLRLLHSWLRVMLPVFDRLLPTTPVKSRDGLRFLFVSRRDIEHPRAGAQETYVHEIAKRFAADGHVVEWLAGGFAGAARVRRVDGVHIRRAGSQALARVAIPLVYLRACRDRFDCIIDVDSGLPFFTPLFSMKPKICLVHDGAERYAGRGPVLGPMARFIERQIVPAVYDRSRFVAASDAMRRRIKSLRLTTHPVDVVYPGVTGVVKPGPKSVVPLAGYAGPLDGDCRIDELVRAFAEVRRAYPHARLQIAGDGNARQSLEALVGTLGLSDAVRIDGPLAPSQTADALRAWWVACDPSGRPDDAAILEAAACGTPSIVVVPPTCDWAFDAASVVACNGASDLAAALSKLFGDRDLRERMSDKAHSRASAYTWDESALSLARSAVRSIIGDDYNVVKISEDWYLLQANSSPRLAPFMIGRIAAKSIFSTHAASAAVNSMEAASIPK